MLYWRSNSDDGRQLENTVCDVIVTRLVGSPSAYSGHHVSRLATDVKEWVLRSNLDRFSVKLIGCNNFHLAELAVENATSALELYRTKTVVNCQ